jgi:hypothetical protein
METIDKNALFSPFDPLFATGITIFSRKYISAAFTGVAFLHPIFGLF